VIEHDKRVTPARADLAAERLRGVIAAERYVPGVTRQIVWPSAPLRREPRPDAPLDTEGLMGELVSAYDESEGWSWVQLEADRYVGYLPTEALSEPLGAPSHRLMALRSFVYPGPDLKLPPQTFLSLGAGVSVLAWSGDYARLKTGGFIWGDHLVPADATQPDFVAIAERLVGTPYLWGGKSSLGLDCSGLVQLCLDLAGLPSPRDTDMQQGALGTPLPLADRSGLRRGDLVFWRGHVGIMLDATRLIHANGHHMAVAIEPLAEAEARIRTNSYGDVVAIRRLDRLGQRAG
jgi:hypothetical protein